MPVSSQIDITSQLFSQIQQDSFCYAADSGAANAYVVTLSPVPVLAAGSTVSFKATNANTGASTLNVNALGAKNILKHGGGALIAGDIAAGQIVTVIYDGTSFQLQGGTDASVISQLIATAQSANYNGGAAFTLFTPSVTGVYRVTVYSIVTQAATTSSTLPSNTIGWTDPTSSVAQTWAATATNSGNTTTTWVANTLTIYAKTGVAVTLTQAGFATSGATGMLFSIVVMAELL